MDVRSQVWYGTSRSGLEMHMWIPGTGTHQEVRETLETTGKTGREGPPELSERGAVPGRGSEKPG